MMDEAILESLPWESDESEDAFESDESIAEMALAEAEDAGEEIGEARRRRRRNRFRAGRGVSGLRIRGSDGRARRIQFPAKLATTTETNRGLASQEAGRRGLEQRIDKLESGILAQQKKDSAVSGAVALAIGGVLTGWSLFKASQPADPKSHSKPFFSKWIAQESARMATLVSVSQITTTGAKFLVNGRYHGSGVGIAADLLAAIQAAGFALASVLEQAPAQPIKVVIKPEELENDIKNAVVGATFYLHHLGGKVIEVRPSDHVAVG